MVRDHCSARTVVWFLILFSMGSSNAYGQSTALPLDAILGTRTFGDRIPLALSPDGQLVAYTVLEPSRKESSGERFTATGVPIDQGASDIWISDLKGGKSRSLTQSKGSSWGPMWSPNGQLLAFYSDRDGRARLWVWERATDRLRAVSKEVVRVDFGFEVVRWTADSKSVLVKFIPEDMTLEQLTALTRERHSDRPSEAQKGGPSVVVYRSKQGPDKAGLSPGWMNSNLCDLVLVDVGSGRTRRIVQKTRVRSAWLSPDNRYLALSIFAGIKPGTQNALYDVAWVALNGGTLHMVASGVSMDYGIAVNWSPAGEWLSFVTGDPDDGVKSEVWVSKVPEGPLRQATEQQHPDFTHPYRGPVWDSHGENIYLIGDNELWEITLKTGSARRVMQGGGTGLAEILGPAEAGRFASPDDGQSLILRTRNQETMEAGFYRVFLGSGKVKVLLGEKKSYGGFDEGLYSQTSNSNASQVIFQAEDSGHGPDLWLADGSFRSPRKVTELNPQLLGIDSGKSALIEYEDSSGKKLKAGLLLPANYEPGKRYPVLTWVYGGADGSNYVYNFGFETSGIDNMQLYATRGYAVLYPDIPIEVGTPVKDIVRSTVAAVNRVVEMGVGDPHRIAVMGHSHGGYTVLALITHCNVFRAAIARAAQGDLVSSYGQMRENSGDAVAVGWSEQGQGKMGGTPWQYRDRYIDNSPFFFLDKVETPLLLVHGSQDITVPPHLADEIFVGLRRLGKDVTYLRYTQAGHWEGDWQYADMRDEFQRILEFLAASLQ